MNEAQIAIVGVGVLAYLVLGGFIFWPKPLIEQAPGDVVLTHGWLLRGTGLFFCVIPTVLVVLAFVTKAKGEDIYAILGLLVFMTLLVSLLMMEAFRARLIISNEGVEQESPWRGRHVVCWDEILEVRYSTTNHWFVLLGPDGQKVRASTYLAGIVALVRAFRVHLPKVRYENAYLGIEQVEKAEPFASPPRRRLD